MKRAEFIYPSVSSSEDRMFTDLTSFLDDANIGADFRHRIMLSVSEAFSNALVHGNHCQAEKQITMRLQVIDMELQADIEDEGTGGMQKLQKRSAPQLLAESGRGIDFIQRYASSVDFAEAASGGLKVMIRFSLQEKSVVEQ